MTFTGFTPDDFAVFAIPGLEPRMAALRECIQPKFRELGPDLRDFAAMAAGNEMFLHIAQHARRKTNPPYDTWLALSGNKRGYKQHPHFEVGLFADHVFIWLACIYELPHKRAIAQAFLNAAETLQNSIPPHFALSFDHTRKDSVPMGEFTLPQLKEALVAFRDRAKTEWLIGRQIPTEDPLLADGEKFIRFAEETLQTLMPAYRLACTAIPEASPSPR